MKRKVKRLICGALAALLIFGGSLAEGGGADAEAQAAIEAQQRAEQEAREQAEREAREQAEREAREKAEREAKEKAEREAKEKAEREAKEKAAREAKEKAEREAKEKAEREAKEKAEREAKEKAEREAKEKAEREAKEKAEREAKEKAEREAKEKAEREAKEKAEREAKEKAEREAKEKAEREAKEKAEAAPADKPKEDKPEEKPAVKEDKPEEKPSNVQEEKPAVKEDKPEEKPADVQEEKPAVKEDKPEEKPSDVQEENPSVKEGQQEIIPEDKPEPVSEDQPKDAPEEAPADATAPDPVEMSEPAEESSESSEDAPIAASDEASPESSEDTPTPEVALDEAPQEDVPAIDETPIESVEASDADASTQSRADAQGMPPGDNAAKPEPVALPDALATEVASAPADIALVPEASKGVTGKDGVYQVAQAMPGKKAAKATLSFPLNYAGECTGYKVSVVDAQGNVVYTGAQTEPAVVLDLSTYKTGSYVLVVEAVSGDAVVAWGQYTFALASGSGFPGGFPGGFGGGFPGGGSGGAPDDMEQEAQGFQVTPGEALAGSHNAGTKDLQRYGTVSLTLSDEAMTELVLGGAALGIVLDGGREAFTAAIDGSRLTLTADGYGVWSFNGRALRILSDSGIETLVLENPAGAHDIATGSPLTGDVYARLCAEGVASSDYDYQVSGDGTRVFVDGQVYRVDDSGAMTPMEGDGYAEAMADAAAGAA